MAGYPTEAIISSLITGGVETLLARWFRLSSRSLLVI